MLARFQQSLTLAILSTIFLVPDSASAGMTVYGLRDIYRMRLQEVSFFLLLLFVGAFLIKVLWNYAVKGFSFLPRLKYLQSFCLSILFGLFTMLILTMISGIREVLTPEAWRRQGSSYRLNDPSQEPARRRSLEQLRSTLLDYARQHEGRFPPSDFSSGIPDKLWEAPDSDGTRYIYSGGHTTNDVASILAAEPLNFGDSRFALFVSGEIRQLSSDELGKLLSSNQKP